jgi:hypothetical protein
MNEQLQAKLVEILSGIQATVKVAGDFALEQLPDIAYHYIAYGRAYYTFLTILAIVGIAIGLWLVIKKAIYGKQLYNNYHWSDNRIAASFGGASLTIFSFFMFAVNVSNTLMVWFAPKIWLIKEIAALIK